MSDVFSKETCEIRAAGDDDLETVRALFRAYAEWLEYAICFEGFEAELRGLPGDYAPPSGGLWLASVGGETAGVIALRQKAAGVGELKRLWVPRRWRGRGLGRLLTEKALAAARQVGYGRVYLETLGRMEAARDLYAALGFSAIAEPHPDGRIEMELVL